MSENTVEIPSSFKLPPIEPQKLFDTFRGVLTEPEAFWRSVRESTGYGPPLMFAAVMGLVSGALSTLLGFGVLNVLAAPIGCVAGSFIGGGVLYVIARIAGGRADYAASVRIAAYTSALLPITAALGRVEPLGFIAGLYGLYLAALGVIELEGAERQKTFLVVAVLAGLVVLAEAAVFLAALSALHAVRG